MTSVEDFEAILAERFLPPIEADCFLADHSGRYVLFERGRDNTWLSWHESPDDAGRYTLNQEYAEDWSPELLLDTQTGAILVPGGIVWARP